MRKCKGMLLCRRQFALRMMLLKCTMQEGEDSTVQGFATNVQGVLGLIGKINGFDVFSSFYRLCRFCGPLGPTGHVGSIGSTCPMGSSSSMGCVGYICFVWSVNRLSNQKKRVVRTHCSQQCEGASSSRIDPWETGGTRECKDFEFSEDTLSGPCITCLVACMMMEMCRTFRIALKNIAMSMLKCQGMLLCRRQIALIMVLLTCAMREGEDSTGSRICN